MEAEMLLTNLERMLSKVSLTIPDGCYSNMQNPKNIKMPQKSMKVCIIVTKMNKRHPSLVIFSVFTFLEGVLIMRIPVPTMA